MLLKIQVAYPHDTKVPITSTRLQFHNPGDHNMERNTSYSSQSCCVYIWNFKRLTPYSSRLFSKQAEKRDLIFWVLHMSINIHLEARKIVTSLRYNLVILWKVYKKHENSQNIRFWLCLLPNTDTAKRSKYFEYLYCDLGTENSGKREVSAREETPYSMQGPSECGSKATSLFMLFL
jgi:hypothetical protein